ncbi:phage shock protein PspC (stress-responsive transcriptional regulator) [Filimonas zeae]|uniref:Phage shock protein C (PspC) family protein n=1 Tax=Filimonas zeae TaxID=1737353 RepID=A0A917J3Q4_9BACT|nr:PspC domain-containing protein [Filimonas zeae]MDR6342676.1 phage shock protein PspC (stress-responsive transcriptional regulator) [Filimonas zeae]GGH82264.1 hypothetical protein GCM10011379_55890 [Filimonas zeae]
MRKIININFQGRVIPIEELAYDILKQYIESLRVFFANEEGRDEIINDIEGRIAELFSETLKKGAACITDSDVNVVINSIGRPEDFDDEETRVKEQLKGEENKQQQRGGNYSSQFTTEPRGPRLFRDQEDKILGGVCAGLASYFRIDPAIVRILFAVITLGGFGAGVPLYILLWIVLPVKKLDRSVISKRLYRNPDDKVIAGVASGVAAYFNLAVWIPRMVFAFPLVIAVLGSIWRNLFWDHFSMPTSIIFSSFGSTFFLVYAILWIVIPEASSASEKLEMRGEKVDLNSIKNTIQEDLGSFKQKAEKWGEEFKVKAQQWSDEVQDTFQTKGKQFGKEAAVVSGNAGNRFAQAIAIAFKAFFLFIAGIIAFSLVLALIALLVSGVNVAPLKTFFLHGFWQNTLAWVSLILFIGSPIVAMVIWVIRRITRVRSTNNYLGYTFGGLWTIGLIASVFLAASITKDYRSRTAIEEDVLLNQPSRGKLLVKVDESKAAYYGEDFWLGFNWDTDDAPFVGVSKDSLLMKSVQVRIVKSADSSFHTQVVKLSNGSSTTQARGYASAVSFVPRQTDDSVLVLPRGFVITSDQKFHNQQVMVVIEVPVGKRIQLDESLSDYHWVNVNVNSHRRRHRQTTDWNEDWNNDFDWSKNVEYVMTQNDGLKATHEKKHGKEDARKQLEELEKQRIELEKKREELERKLPVEDSSAIKNQEQVAAPAVTEKATAMENGEPELAPRPSGMLLMKFIR